MRLLVTRPEEDAARLAAELRALGHDVVLAPVMTIVELGDAPLPLEDVQAVLATSANGVRAFVRRSPRRDLPLYAVGDATARTARAAGFATVRSANGDVDALAHLVARSLARAGGPLLHVTGSVAAGDLSGRLEGLGFTVNRAVLYRAEPARSLAPEAAAALKAGTLDGVLLFSPRTARLFVELAQAAGAGLLSAAVGYCLSRAVANVAAPGGFARLVVAEKPNQASLFAALTLGDKA